MRTIESLVDRFRRCLPANGSRLRLCLERLPHSALETVRLDHFSGHFALHHQLVFSRHAPRLLGGLWINRAAPRTVAITGGLLWGIGVFLASFSAHKLWWLYLTYGVIGGTGLGMGYIVPISVLVKWFPDRRGLITGIAVGGFGAGSLIAAPVAHSLIEQRRCYDYLCLSRHRLCRRCRCRCFLHVQSA